jgi:hypothetical protein
LNDFRSKLFGAQALLRRLDNDEDVSLNAASVPPVQREKEYTSQSTSIAAIDGDQENQDYFQSPFDMAGTQSYVQMHTVNHSNVFQSTWRHNGIVASNARRADASTANTGANLFGTAIKIWRDTTSKGCDITILAERR